MARMALAHEASHIHVEHDIETWWCVRTPPYFCKQCRMEFEHLHDKKKIVVWPKKDDPNMLRVAKAVRNEGGKPKIEKYYSSYGKAISFYNV